MLTVGVGDQSTSVDESSIASCSELTMAVEFVLAAEEAVKLNVCEGLHGLYLPRRTAPATFCTAETGVKLYCADHWQYYHQTVCRGGQPVHMC